MRNDMTAQVRPADEEKHKWIHRLAIEPAYDRASLSTSKIRLWQILRVQAVASYDWETRSPGLQWRYLPSPISCCLLHACTPLQSEIFFLFRFSVRAQGVLKMEQRPG